MNAAFEIGGSDIIEKLESVLVSTELRNHGINGFV